MPVIETTITCENCNTSTPTEEDIDIETWPTFNRMTCNYCPNCENDMDDYYEEYYVDQDGIYCFPQTRC